MDPNACLRMLLDAHRNGDSDSADEHRGDLCDWMTRGGFPPDFSRLTPDDRALVTRLMLVGATVVEGMIRDQHIVPLG